MSAFKIQYTHGIQSRLLKTKDETEDGMQIVNLKKKQIIAKVFYKRADMNTLELQFID
jgi:hypothetical protein